jgi:hypothetical protein
VLDNEVDDGNHTKVPDSIVESDSAPESKMDSRVQTGSYNSDEVRDDSESRVTDRRVSNSKKVRTDTSERNPRTPGPIRRASKIAIDEEDEEALREYCFNNMVDNLGLATESYYAVRKGRNPGIYCTWDECDKQVNKFPGAEHKKFKTFDEAFDFFRGQDSKNTSKSKRANDGSASKHNPNHSDSDKSEHDDESQRSSSDRHGNSRRMSVLLKNASHIAREGRTVPLRIQSEPDISHLSLTKTEPRYIIALIHGADKVMNDNDYVIKIQKCISRSVRNIMMVRMNISEARFYELEYAEVINGLALLIRPNSPKEFWLTMRDNLVCRGTYKKEDYENYYLSVLS